MKRNAYIASKERLDQYVLANGLRPSVVRDTVLEQLCELKQPFTARELTEICQTQRISKATVYNSLELFISAQILRGTNRQRGRTAIQYELILDSQQKIQMICQDCGRVSDFRDKAIERLILERKYSNFNLMHFSLLVYGRCKKCKTIKKTKK